MSEQNNIQHLLTLLKARLNSHGQTKHRDELGNVIYVDCDIFTNAVLEHFLTLSLSEFNQYPKFTNFTFENDKFVETFSAILISGATAYALASKALIERGREFKIENNGCYFDPPSVAELMNTQYMATLQDHGNKLRYIKDNIKDFLL